MIAARDAQPIQPGHPPPVQTVRTAAGRAVGYYEYGDPQGAPVFALHGTPTCGAGFAWAALAARRRGLRLIAPDRPGVGLSDRARLPLVAGYGAELAATADALGIDRFGVLGYSGGGPHALAAAYAMPERVATVGVAAGMGQLGGWATTADYGPTDRRLLALSVRRPRAARLVLGTVARLARVSPGSALRSFKRELSPSDRAVLSQLGSPKEAMAGLTAAFLRGAAGAVDDYARLARAWGFPVEGITISVRLWHGAADTIVPLDHTRALAERLRSTAQLNTWPGEGHLALVTHIEQVLDEIGAAVRSIHHR
jgi:pimeloyl-ACP methyl ester carboxylesterase